MSKSRKINYQAFTWFEKQIIADHTFADMRPASKTVLPALLVHAHSGVCWPSEETLASLCGITEKTVRGGVRGLQDSLPGFSISRQLSKRGNWVKRYYLNRPSRYDSGNAFPFYRCILDGGNWSRTLPSSHALYIAMRCFSYFDGGIYMAEENLASHIDDKQLFRTRKYDLCQADTTVLHEHAGISPRSGTTALSDLQEHGLVEPMGSVNRKRTWKVFLIPSKIYSGNALNT